MIYINFKFEGIGVSALLWNLVHQKRARIIAAYCIQRQCQWGKQPGSFAGQEKKKLLDVIEDAVKFIKTAVFDHQLALAALAVSDRDPCPQALGKVVLKLTDIGIE